MVPTPTYDELHVVSDLHMGGAEGFQIFNQGPLLAQTIEHLRGRLPEKQLALAINGDMVDFLAEPNSLYFDPLGAIDKLDRITRDPAFEPVWTALSEFVNTPHRTLAINLGNHDLELALPWVRDWLVQKLSGGKAEALGRIKLVFDGTGFRCRVGSADVICLHGNEVDDWNFCNYEALREQARDLTLGLPAESWTPNAGTKLVIDVMNKIKRHYPFVDLLKPELGAVVPTLYALDPSLRHMIGAAMGVAAKGVRDKLLRLAGFLGKDDAEAVVGAEEVYGMRALDSLLSESFGAPRTATSRDSEPANYYLLQAEKNFLQEYTAMDLVSESVDDRKLGWGGAFVDWITGKEKSEVLREALEHLSKDQSFDLRHADATFQSLDKLVAGDIDFVISGHTHHERALYRQSGGGFYYNSGTWVRLIRLPPDVLHSPDRFAGVYKVFEKGTMAALDQADGLVLRHPAVVSIVQGDSTVRGCIHRVEADGAAVTLNPVEGSEFERS